MRIKRLAIIGLMLISSLHLGAQQLTLHGVTLPFDPSATPGVVNYSVWRGTHAGGPYNRLIAPSPMTSYTDTNVVAGTTYFYVGTAILNGVESKLSNEVSATIPVTKPQILIITCTRASDAVPWACTSVTSLAAKGKKKVDR